MLIKYRSIFLQQLNTRRRLVPHRQSIRQSITMMKAAVIYEAGGPEVLKLEQRPIPKPTLDQVLIRVKAFGLNRSELFTRQGYSPNVRFPRILGIEAVGIVEESPSDQFKKGDVVATAMGGMGRDWDGAYAEYTCPPANQVQVHTDLDWTILGALPEMLQVSLFKALKLQKGEVLLIRGGTTSVGLATAAIAKRFGANVISTSRRTDSEHLLLSSGADKMVLDTGTIAKTIREMYPEGVHKVLELVGTTTLLDSLQCTREGGAVCMTGMVGNKWSFDEFSPMDAIPSTVNLTIYDGGNGEFMETPYTELLGQISTGEMIVQVGKTFTLDEIVEAHRTMEENRARGKIVVVA